MTDRGRQDLAAVIAEMQEVGDRLADQGEDPLARRVVRWADRLAILLAEAPQHQETKAPEHVCGLSGYNGMIDPPCPACEHWRALVASGRDADGPIVRPSALLETRGVPQEENRKENDTRVVDSQYDPPSAGPLATAATNEPGPTTFPIPLNAAQEQAAKDWAADDRLWTTQDTVEFNLRTFARVILKLVAPLARAPQEPQDEEKEQTDAR